MNRRVDDRSIENAVSTLLRTGVTLSGLIVLMGGVLLLATQANDPVDFHSFRSQPESERQLAQILSGVWALRPRSIIQLGILLLIATPIARVGLSLLGFLAERDTTYVVITSIVLAILAASLIWGLQGGV